MPNTPLQYISAACFIKQLIVGKMMEKQFVDLLSELKLQKNVGQEHMRHMNITFGEAKRAVCQYQKEAEK
ncbi:hypothetical protein Hanom_Chr06g00524031 [Helianthus anomalus]